ncbi:putative DDE superfamily endonuclease [Monocercomonoides exilis]|uniref:putative DDE superfamily endonuclease n=1 Tax=Monocercomonoides exilis TaxID=2049356 RepID=UPI00355A2736|nr:putative DDE superfamily endonuclease [Monocercomonoides exilis]|eukprot:MONOS_14281.1-p1 / transcript=MONOS_14281.1 / gene=MONOS_14281 / organism=Monocercomonoides_exilis_PA203 / gene_product=unspecified product / transcript_product=unspecified product / location=Mono_scaffold00970:18972-20492(-) / protein_length=279 / sequence_SO=supercontig / SO=protein_coding / is_pseudo=false
MMAFDYRQIENRLERIATIVFDGKARIVDTANLHEFSRSAINRAIAALENKRKIGKIGHPELLTDEEKKTVEDVIRCESSSGVSISVSQKKQLPFYELLQHLHNTYKYSSSLIFNTDESSLRLSDTTKKLVVHPSDSPAGFNKTPMNMPNATLCVAAAADGYSLKSVVLWPSKKIPAELRVMVSSSINIWEDNDGWMTDARFRRYAEDVLLPGIVERRTLLDKDEERCLLLLDSHPSRAQPDIWQKFANASIDVVTFIPHSTHLTQPLDRGVFAVFKKS